MEQYKCTQIKPQRPERLALKLSLLKARDAEFCLDLHQILIPKVSYGTCRILVRMTVVLTRRNASKILLCQIYP